MGQENTRKKVGKENPAVAAAIKEHGSQPGALLPVLQAVQRNLGALERETLCGIAEALDIPLSEVYSTASFYTLFRLGAKGRHIIRVCENAGCYANGAAEVVEAVMDILKIKPGETTGDGKYSLEFTSCLGACNESPAVMVDNEIYGGVTPAKIKEIIRSLK
ncbi:MAG: NAD(P)H-dependent oxidoreductase subunit E [Bacillota bacterium]